jgi:serine protease Do
MVYRAWLQGMYRYSAVLCGLLWLVVGVEAGAADAGRLWQERTPDLSVEINHGLDIFIALAERLSPAVVNISTVQKKSLQGQRFFRDFRTPWQDRNPPGTDPFHEFFERFFGEVPPEARQSLGSGFIINANGLILTNNHVVEEADKIKVILQDERELEAQIVGRDAKTDLALIKVQAEGPLPTAPLGDSDRLRIGEWVMAIGNPFGLSHTVTAGIVSAKGRVIGAGQYDDFIQTDASINPGNSGGPLFNTRGEVVGINTAIVAGGTGIGFAIAVNLVKELLPQLYRQGRVTRGWLGVVLQKVTPSLARSVGLPRPRGALVAEVLPDSPAVRGGLRPGDVITAFDGFGIEAMHDLPRVVAKTPVGKTVAVEVWRQGETVTQTVKVAELKDETPSPASEVALQLGMTVETYTPERAEDEGRVFKAGVVVVGVEAHGVAAEAGVRQGDIILEVNRQPIRHVHDYAKVIEQATDTTILLLIERGETTRYVALQR